MRGFRRKLTPSILWWGTKRNPDSWENREKTTWRLGIKRSRLPESQALHLGNKKSLKNLEKDQRES